MREKPADGSESEATDSGDRRRGPGKGGIRDTIVSAGASLFRSQGFAATSMQQIADASGLTRAALYYHFRNKEEILASLVEEITIKSLRRAFQLGAEQSSSPDEGLRSSVRAYALWILRHLEQFAVLSRNEHELPEADRNLQRQGRRELLNSLKKAITNGIDAGCFRMVDPSVAALSIFGMCNWTIEWFSSGGRLSEEQTADAIADLALAMVRRPVTDGQRSAGDAAGWISILRDDVAQLERALVAPAPPSK